jgi:lipoprotein-releasing system ATP-binding protein
VTSPLPILAVENLRKTYRLGRVEVPVLRGVSMSLAEGEALAVLGASGSGKSTLLHLIGGLDRPDRALSASRGERGGAGAVPRDERTPSVRFRGRELERMSGRELNDYRGREVGFVFQFYHLLPELTVLQNVVVACMAGLGAATFLRRRGECIARATDLLTRVGLGHRLKHRPAELSGGERQRVAIARGLVNKPALLLADEPTGNLDRKTGGTILDLLDEIRRETRQSMVIVTHDPDTAVRADRVITLEDGLVKRAGFESRVATA